MPPNEQPTLPAEGVYSDLEHLWIAEQPKNLWPLNQNSNLGALRKVLTDQLTVALAQISELALERFVDTSEGYLGLWEEMVGLPKNPANKTLVERKGFVKARLRKGYLTRAQRNEIVESHIILSPGESTALTPDGVPRHQEHR